MARNYGILGAALAASLALSGAAYAKDIKLLASWSPANKGTYLSETTFIKLVGEASKGALTIKRSGPGSSSAI